MPKRKDDKSYRCKDGIRPENVIGSDGCALLIGPPNCGKTFAAERLVRIVSPEIEYAILVHPHAGKTGDYDVDDFDKIFTSVPSIDDLGYLKDEEDLHKASKILIIDEQAVRHGKDPALRELFSYGASHFNMRVICTCHNLTDVDPKVRNCAQWFYLWYPNDVQQLRNIKSQLGLDMKEIFSEIPRHLRTVNTFVVYHQGTHRGHTLQIDGVVPMEKYDSPLVCNTKPKNFAKLKRKRAREEFEDFERRKSLKHSDDEDDY